MLAMRWLSGFRMQSRKHARHSVVLSFRTIEDCINIILNLKYPMLRQTSTFNALAKSSAPCTGSLSLLRPASGDSPSSAICCFCSLF